MFERNKELARRFYEAAVNNPGALEELVAEDFRDHHMPKEFGFPEGPAGIMKWHKYVKAAFPDLKIELHDIFAEDDKVMVRFTVSGTHRGTYMNVPPSGKRLWIIGLGVLRIVDDKVVEAWENTGCDSDFCRCLKIGLIGSLTGTLGEPDKHKTAVE